MMAGFIVAWFVLMGIGFWAFIAFQQAMRVEGHKEMLEIEGVRCVAIRGAGVDCDW